MRRVGLSLRHFVLNMPWNIYGFKKNTRDGRWVCRRIGNPIAPLLQPEAAGSFQVWIGAWGEKPGRGCEHNPRLCALNCIQWVAHGTDAVQRLIMRL